MQKRGAVNISIETIMILIVAVVALGLMLMLVRGWLIKAGDIIDIGPPEIKADEGDPVSFPLKGGVLEMTRGQKVNMKTSFYNKEDSPITDGAVRVECSQSTEGQTLNVDVSTAPVTVDINKEITVATQLAIPADATRTDYPCRMTVSETKKDFFIRVK